MKNLELRQGFKPTDYSEHIKEYCKKYDIILPLACYSLKEKKYPCNTIQQEESVTLKEKTPPIIYNCYQCVKANHGTPTFETNSQKEYETHWLQHNIKTTCYPNNDDCDRNGWIKQNKEWET